MRRGSIALTPVLITFAAVAGFVVMLWYALGQPDLAPTQPVACSREAKLCPDGSSVGREGKNCAFALCPGESAVTNFIECEAAGYAVMESYPRQCRANNQTFVEQLAVAKDACVITGCSGQICSDQDQVSTCEFLDEYACYQSAGVVCERQDSGECGWTQSDALRSCIEAAQTSNPEPDEINHGPAALLTVNEVTSDPTAYDGAYVCISGHFFQGFESSILAADISGYPGETWRLIEPWIWVNNPPDRSLLTCNEDAEGAIDCHATTGICGRFDYAAEGEPGFGHVSSYRYQISEQQRGEVLGEDFSGGVSSGTTKY